MGASRRTLRRAGFAGLFARQVTELAPPGSRPRASLFRAVNRLRREDLPGPHDEEAGVSRFRVVAVRKVPNHDLWIWYEATEETLVLRDLTEYPPQDVPW